MEKLLKSELKVRAIRLGIKNGYHGRVISKMRKKILLILLTNQIV